MYFILNSEFFRQSGQIQDEDSNPQRNRQYDLIDKQAKVVSEIVEKIENEFNSGNNQKSDQIRNFILELVHFGLKLQPALLQPGKRGNASHRITSSFLELLEQQFPIDDSNSLIQLTTPSAFADRLNSHVNHLNRAIKEMTGKTRLN